MLCYKRCGQLLNVVLNYTFRNQVSFSFPQRLTNYPLGIKRNISFSKTLQKNVSFCLTDIGEGISEVVLKEWYVKEGDRVSQFDNICEVQSDKASVTITSRYDGIITKRYYNIEETALVGNPLVDIETDKDETFKEESKEDKVIIEENREKESIQKPSREIFCIPSVRRIAKEKNIDLSEVKATGKGGRILKEDLIRYLQASQKTPQVSKALPEKTGETIILRGFQRAMVKTMTAALQIPHFLFCEEIEITKLKELINPLKKTTTENKIKLTLTPILVKAISNSLKEFPILNSSTDEKCEMVIKHAYHNIGIAMDTSQGLAVPVIKNVENLSIKGIAEELSRLKQTGKKGVFSTEDVTGGTFTVSNIGMIGGTYASPVILHPQVAIIAFGRIRVVPRFDESDNIKKEEIVYVSAAADHRIVDGATMAGFINHVKEQIENPHLLLLT